VTAGLYAIGIAVLAGIAAPIAIVVTRRRDALMWFVISICLSALGLVIGGMLLFVAVVERCGPNCFS
jgi:hypothetical protein